MPDIIAMRLDDAVLCACGAEATPRDPQVLQLFSRPAQCPSCRDAEAADRALLTRRTLTELVADERGYALHRRTLPEIGTSVDHLFGGATGVFVIDLVHVPDADVPVASTGGRFASGPEVLTVGGSRATHLVDAVHDQCAEVAAGLADHGQGEVPVTPVLCLRGRAAAAPGEEPPARQPAARERAQLGGRGGRRGTLRRRPSFRPGDVAGLVPPLPA